MDNGRRVSDSHGLKKREENLIQLGIWRGNIGLRGRASRVTAGQNDAMRKLSTRYADIK